MIDIRQRDGVRNRDSTFILFTHYDRWGHLVQPNPKAFQLGFDDLFVAKRLEDVKYDENKVASSGDWRDCLQSRSL